MTVVDHSLLHEAYAKGSVVVKHGKKQDIELQESYLANIFKCYRDFNETYVVLFLSVTVILD